MQAYMMLSVFSDFLRPSDIIELYHLHKAHDDPSCHSCDAYHYYAPRGGGLFFSFAGRVPIYSARQILIYYALLGGCLLRSKVDVCFVKQMLTTFRGGSSFSMLREADVYFLCLCNCLYLILYSTRRTLTIFACSKRGLSFTMFH